METVVVLVEVVAQPAKAPVASTAAMHSRFSMCKAGASAVP
jgi:hypothetical protein